MEVDNIYKERPPEVQCHRCKGFGHIAKNCATRPRPGERTPVSQNVRRHRVTNIESRSVRKGCKPVEYCGNTWGLPVATKRLPCYLGTMEGRVVRALGDSGATDNFVAKGLLKEDLHKGQEITQNADVMLADGTKVMGAVRRHGVKFIIGNCEAMISAVEIPIEAFDLILGIPWLEDVQPEIDWATHEMTIDCDVIRPVTLSHQAPYWEEKCKVSVEREADQGDHEEQDELTTCNEQPRDEEDVIPVMEGCGTQDEPTAVGELFELTNGGGTNSPIEEYRLLGLTTIDDCPAKNVENGSLNTDDEPCSSSAEEAGGSVAEVGDDFDDSKGLTTVGAKEGELHHPELKKEAKTKGLSIIEEPCQCSKNSKQGKLRPAPPVVGDPRSNVKKRRSKKRNRRGVAVMIRHFEPPSKETIAHSQGVNIGAVTPDPSEQPTETKTAHKVTIARSLGSAWRWKMSRWVCTLFIGLAGALITTALLSTPGHQGLVAAPTRQGKAHLSHGTGTGTVPVPVPVPWPFPFPFLPFLGPFLPVPR